MSSTFFFASFAGLLWGCSSHRHASGLLLSRERQQRTLRNFMKSRGPAADALVSDERPICVYGPKEGFGGHVQVFVSTDNSRYLEFDHDGVGSQTEVKCRGQVPPDCASPSPVTGAAASWSVNTTQSCELLDCPCDRDISSLDFSYMVDMMQEVTPLCESWSVLHSGAEASPMRVLLVGLGGGALPAYIVSHCPSGTARVESVEYDPRVVMAAEKFFGFNVQPGKNEVETNDGGAALARRAESATYGQEAYDAVLVDCFGDAGEVPDSCKSEAFIANAKTLLKRGGKMIQQIWSPQYEKVIERYKASFGPDNVQGKDIELGVNHLIIATKEKENSLLPGSRVDADTAAEERNAAGDFLTKLARSHRSGSPLLN